MKSFLAVLALATVAFAAPESDPALLYSNYYAAPWAYNYAAPYAYSAAPAVYSSYSAYAGWPYNYNLGSRHLFKRETHPETETEADADTFYYYPNFYSAPWTYNYAAPYTYNYAAPYDYMYHRYFL